MTSIVEVIQHYQRSIDSSQENEVRLLHCINKLYKLPIEVEHLQETGVGKTVNSLRKFNGEIGVAAKTLVTKWKAMVAAQEEPMETTSQTNESETHTDTTPHNDEDDENHNRNSASQKISHSKNSSGDKNDKHKEKHKNPSSSSNKDGSSKHSTSTSSDHQKIEKASKHSHEKHKSSSSKSKSSSNSNHKDKEREKEKCDHKSSRDKHKERHNEKDKERSDKKRDEKSKLRREQKMESPNSTHSTQMKSNCYASSSKSKHEDKHSHSSSLKDKEHSKHKSSSKDKERTNDEKPQTSTLSKDKQEHKNSTSKSSTKDPDSAERKRRHNADNDSIDFKSPQPKKVKLHKSSSSTTASRAESSPPLMASEEEVVDDSFDSSMGANFDDVLGMLNMPVKKSKKSTKSPSTPSNSSSSSTSKKDSIARRQSTIISSSGSISSNKVIEGRLTSSTSYSTPSTSKASTLKPDLLEPTAILEPLDPNIALELPTISTNYKPMPLNQTVMDCVFNTASSSSKPVRTLTDAEAITHGISSKTMRTKIYSGVRTGQTFQVPSLFDMCIRLLQKNIDALEYTGGVPFEVLKPVLERATPQQLYVFEEYNPYLMEDSDIVWQQHVSRNYRTKKRIENESWREMFIRCQEEDERRLSVLKDSIKASQKIAAAPVRKTQLAFIDSMVKPPRNVIKKQEQFGTKSKLVATPAARVASLSSVTPNAAKTGDQRLKVPSTVRDHAQVSSSSIRPKKAPLMQKTLQFIRGRHKR